MLLSFVSAVGGIIFSFHHCPKNYQSSYQGITDVGHLRYKDGDHARFFIQRVIQTSTGPSLFLSLLHEKLGKKLLVSSATLPVAPSSSLKTGHEMTIELLNNLRSAL
jgi:hypothetical protein